MLSVWRGSSWAVVLGLLVGCGKSDRGAPAAADPSSSAGGASGGSTVGGDSVTVTVTVTTTSSDGSVISSTTGSLTVGPSEPSLEALALFEQCDGAAEYETAGCSVTALNPSAPTFDPECSLSVARPTHLFIGCSEVPYIEWVGAGGAAGEGGAASDPSSEQGAGEYIHHWSFDQGLKIEGDTCEHALAADFIAVVACPRVG